MDRAHFSMMTGGDTALQSEVLALFEAQAELWRRLLIVDAPIQTWREAAHSLKGSARGLGFWALAEQCEAVEALGHSAARDGPIVARELAAARARLSEALEHIRLWREDMSAPAGSDRAVG